MHDEVMRNDPARAGGLKHEMRVLFSKGITFISKPRCGSTSIRLMLDPFVSSDEGDIAVNIAGENPPFHPHITAPYLKKLLSDRGSDISSMSFFTVVRNPLDMLWSYYNYFRPDSFSRYYYSSEWAGDIGMSFEHWIMNGRVGMNEEWKKMAPTWISTQDLSPLSLEAHAFTAAGENVVNRIFRIEDIEEARVWFSGVVGMDIKIIYSNASRSGKIPSVGEEVISKIHEMFPYESKLYKV